MRSAVTLLKTSGCLLNATALLPLCSYDYFQPKGITTEQQQLFHYIEDADLWR